MTDFYLKLSEKSGFDKELIERALDFTKAVDLQELSYLFFDAEDFTAEQNGCLAFEDAFYPSEFYGRLSELCKELDVCHERLSLYIYIAFCEKAFGKYTERGISHEVFFDTLKSVSDSAKVYVKEMGNDGVYDYHFLANHIAGNILRLGVFEYQYGSFDGKRAVILHVPQNADMSKEKRYSSYRLAKKRFGDYPIVADSWLLYKEHVNMLGKDSRIVDFMNDFCIVSGRETTDYRELFHVFGRRDDYSPDLLPEDTSLRRAYAERIRQGKPVGSGMGILKDLI